MREEIFEYTRKKYNTTPEYLWKSAPNYAVLRNSNSKKWYAVIMDIPRNRIGLPDDKVVDIIDLKCDPVLVGSLRSLPGYFPGYHMNKGSWITIILDGTVNKKDIFRLIDLSYELSEKKPVKALQKHLRQE